MTGTSVGALLRAPVLLHGIQLAWPVDVIFDRERRRAVGVEVHCRDDERRFLPLTVASYTDDALVVASSLVLLDRTELGFYRERGATFATLRGASVERGRRVLGTLRDVKLDPDGWIEELAVESATGVVNVPYDEGVSLTPAVRAAS